MTLSSAIKALGDALRTRERNSGYTGTFTAFLGDPTNGGKITAEHITPGRKVWFYVAEGPGLTPSYVGAATLTTNDIFWGDDTAERKQKDLAVTIGYPPKSLNIDGHCVFGVSGGLGRAGQGDQTQIEKEIIIAQTPQLTVAGLDGTTLTNISLIEFPANWVSANPGQPNTALITPPSGGAGGSSPSPAPPVKYHNSTDQTNAVPGGGSAPYYPGAQWLAFDTKDADSTPVCDHVPDYWEFVAPADGSYTFTADVLVTSNMDSTQTVELTLNPPGHVAAATFGPVVFGGLSFVRVGGYRTLHLTAGQAISVAAIVPAHKLDGTTAVTVGFRTASRIQVDWTQAGAASGGALLPVRTVTYVSGTSAYKLVTGQPGQTLVSVTAQVQVAFNAGAYASIGTLADHAAGVDYINLTDATSLYVFPCLNDASSDLYLFFNGATSLNSIKVALLLGV